MKGYNEDSDVTVVIPTVFNLFDDPKVLSLLFECDYFRKLIVVVEVANKDYIEKAMRVYYDNIPAIMLVLDSHPSGLASAFNKGLKLSDTKYTMMMADDIYATDGFITSLQRALDEHENLGWVSSIQLNHPEFPFTAMCSMIRTDLLKDVDYLDERFNPACFDDADLVMKVRSYGYRVVGVRSSKVYHLGDALTVSRLTNHRSGETKGLYEINRKKFEEKWGIDNFYWADIEVIE